MKRSQVIKAIETMKPTCHVIATRPVSNHPNDTHLMYALCKDNAATIEPYIVWLVVVDGDKVATEAGRYRNTIEEAIEVFNNR